MVADPAPNSSEDLASGLVATLRELVREEITEAMSSFQAQAPEGGAAIDAEALLATDGFKSQINGCMEQAFQTVLPQLIRRFKEEIDERLNEFQANGGGGGADPAALVNSEALKEMLDGRFRQMMLYLKQDVIPKVVDQRLTTA